MSIINLLGNNRRKPILLEHRTILLCDIMANMSTLETLTIEDGKIALPVDVCERYGFVNTTPIRLVRTSKGILLVPLTDEPMSAELTAELEEWQALGVEGLEMFSYEEKRW